MINLVNHPAPVNENPADAGANCPASAAISNTCSLEEIATRIRQVQRNNIIEIGELLMIAKNKLKHGDFLPWAETTRLFNALI